MGSYQQNGLISSVKRKEQQYSLILPYFFISLLKVQTHQTLCGFQVALGMNKDFRNSLELLCLNRARMFFTHPFVTRTPVGATSLLSASKVQRYKFWDDFLLVKSCTKTIPEVKE